MKKAFTLMELVVCLGIIGVLSIMMLSAMRARPNTNSVMYRKAYNTTTNIVYEMLQSSVWYDAGELSNLSETLEKINEEAPQGKSKFCKIFASYLNTTNEVDCSSNNADKPSFSTADGLDWFLPPKTTTGDFTSDETITVDVNGIENLPNCKESESCQNPDIFDIQVTNIGKIIIVGDIAKGYMRNVRNITK